MTIGKLVVGFWIPIAEIRVRRRSSSVFTKTDSVGSQDVSLTEKGADKTSRIVAGRWTIEWPTKSSIAPAMMLSTAMVARGEIGFVLLIFTSLLHRVSSLLIHHVSQNPHPSSWICFLPRTHRFDCYIRGRIPHWHMGRSNLHYNRSDHIFIRYSALSQHGRPKGSAD